MGCADKVNLEMNLVLACQSGDIQLIEEYFQQVEKPGLRESKRRDSTHNGSRFRPNGGSYVFTF